MSLKYLRPLLLGGCSALIVIAQRALWQSSLFSEYSLSTKVFCGVIFLTSIVAFLIHYYFHSSVQKGIIEFISQIFLHSKKDLFAFHWIKQSFLTFCYALIGKVGPEGLAMEVTQAGALLSRTPHAHWSETQRRLDTAVIISASLSAAFGAPLAAVVFTIELGMGAPVLPVLLASVCASALTYSFGMVPIVSWPTMHLSYDPKLWGSLLFVSIAVALSSLVVLRLIQTAQKSFYDVFQDQEWVYLLVGGLLLLSVTFAVPLNASTFELGLQNLFIDSQSAIGISITSIAYLLIIVLLVSAFRFTGIIWPLLTMGCLLGSVFDFYTRGAPGIGVLLGGVIMLSCVLGTPMAAIFLGLEMTGQWSAFPLCAASVVIAFSIRKLFRVDSLLFSQMKAFNIEVQGGRLKSVLDEVKVKEAMITDFEIVREDEELHDLKLALKKSAYPFLVVVNTRGFYVGLLSFRQIIIADRELNKVRQKNERVTALEKKFVEARDLLFVAKESVPTVKMNQSIAEVDGLFSGHPVISVLDLDQKIVGLLLMHEVRIAYNRAIERKVYFKQKEEDWV